jgi:hypothetical protein
MLINNDSYDLVPTSHSQLSLVLPETMVSPIMMQHAGLTIESSFTSQHAIEPMNASMTTYMVRIYFDILEPYFPLASIDGALLRQAW